VHVEKLTLECRFPVYQVQGIIKEVLKEFLDGQGYTPDQTSLWTKEISDEVKRRVKGKIGRKSRFHRLSLTFFGSQN